MHSRKIDILFAVLCAVSLALHVIPAGYRNDLAVRALEVFMDDSVSLDEQLNRLSTLEKWYILWHKANVSTSSRGWMERIASLINNSKVPELQILQKDRGKLLTIEATVKKGAFKDAAELLNQYLAENPQDVTAYFIQALLPDRFGNKHHIDALRALIPQYELHDTFLDGVQLLGFDIVEEELWLGVSQVQVVLYWEIPGGILDANSQPSVAVCHQNTFWTWYCSGNKLWSIGKVENLFRGGSFELTAGEHGVIPAGFYETYRKPDTDVSFKAVKVAYNGTTRALCLQNRTSEGVSLASVGTKVDSNATYLIFAKTRTESPISTRLGMAWEADSELYYDFLDSELSQQWQSSGGIFKSPSNTTSASLRYLNKGLPGEICLDHVFLFPVPRAPKSRHHQE